MSSRSFTPSKQHLAGDAARHDARGDRCQDEASRSIAVNSGDLHAGSIGSSQPVRLDIDRMMPEFERLVADTVAQMEACPAKADSTFAGYESLLAALRSATTLEGTLLERGIALVCAANPDLTLVHLDRPLPVHETAKAVFRRNDWSRASGLRLDSEVATREFYRPDLLVVDGPQQLALIIDVKRSVASYKQRVLGELRSRMMASALVVRDVLERDHDAPPVARADIAIIDGAGDSRDEAKGIFALTDLDWMLRIEGASSAITQLRDLYGAKVRAVLDRRCGEIAAQRIAVRGFDAGRHSDRAERPCNLEAGSTDSALPEAGLSEDHRNDTQLIDGVNDGTAFVADDAPNGAKRERSLGDDDDIDRELATCGDGAFRSRAGVQVPAVAIKRVRPRVTVGIASRRMH